MHGFTFPVSQTWFGTQCTAWHVWVLMTVQKIGMGLYQFISYQFKLWELEFRQSRKFYTWEFASTIVLQLEPQTMLSRKQCARVLICLEIFRVHRFLVVKSSLLGKYFVNKNRCNYAMTCQQFALVIRNLKTTQCTKIFETV